MVARESERLQEAPYRVSAVNERSAKIEVGPGSGWTCDGCGMLVGPFALEYLVEFVGADGVRLLRFHTRCFVLWEDSAGRTHFRQHR